ncbi:inositol polyphosphate kinase family protein [Streptomyces olivaceus]|uniref:inositol polyphosphate kinase family protein n=1 Tax=Streptomyces olivaceus TaxID=47716 RepID=UPI0018A81626|nr:inositol polyphosphate kinase family protein [Streptomyces olivaceus]MBF8173943.1 inositol polyphosphate kinase family protein [Streptomyces olivaceus]
MHHRKDRTRTEDLERERRAARGGATATRQPADAGSLPALTASLQNTAGNAAMSQVVDTARQGGASTVPGAVQRAVHPGANATPVQRAEEKATGGHGGIKKRADGRILEKPTNDVERNFYSDMRAGKHPELNDVVPGSHTAGAVKEMDSETGGSDDTHIYIDNLTQGMNKPKLLDIKVGESTSSKQELLLTMEKADAVKKKAKLKLADVMTGSKANDYRVVGGTDLGDSRLKNGMLSKHNIGKFSNDASVYDELLPQLGQVRQAAKSSGLAFIAASVLIAVDQEPADGSQAATAKLNLIDFAHTFDTSTMSEEQTEKYRERFDKGMQSLIEDVKAAADKARKKEAA